MNPLDLRGQTSIRPYRLLQPNHKNNYQIKKITSLEDFQQQQKQKWIAHVTRKENGIIKMLTFHTTLNNTRK